MDTIQGLRIFAAVVETGSFTAAADREGLSTALASKYVAQLEERLGARLLHRTTRKVRLTDVGGGFYERAMRLIEDYDELCADVRDDHREPRGHLRVTASVTFGELHIAPLVASYLDAYPEMSVELYLTDRRVGLIDEGYDVAIRIGDLEMSALIAKRLGDAPVVVCATPAYLTAHGAPETPSDLSAHRCIIDTNLRTPGAWPFLIDGERETVRVSGRFRVNSAMAVRDQLLADQGVGLCPRHVIARELEEGRLVEVLRPFRALDFGVYAVFLENRRLSGKIRTFIDHLSERYAVAG